MTVQPTRDQLRALANAATPGPWEVQDDELTGTGVAHCCMTPDAEDRADMEFIAAARNAPPALLQSSAWSLLQDAWEAAEAPESRVIEPGQRFIARTDGGNFYTMEAVTRMSSRGLVHELRLL